MFQNIHFIRLNFFLNYNRYEKKNYLNKKVSIFKKYRKNKKNNHS